MNKNFLMAEMTSPEFAERVAAGATVILPTGTTEQHGPHLPLGVDFQIPQAVALDVARQTGSIVAPPVTFGYKSMPRSGGGPFFAGTIGLDGATLSHMIRDVIRELARHGVRKICVLDGNYENLWFLNEGVDLAYRELKECGIKIMVLQHWDFITDATFDTVFPDGFPGIELEHAAVLETSLMMHYYPHLVREGQIPDNGPARSGPYDVWPPHKDWVPDSGALISAKGSSAEKGRMIAEQVGADIISALKREFEI
ncbi:MAG: creatininase [Gammaproteobacteria bacterium]|nr:creatininase [Gammaproteobacteria bacterium]